MARKKTQEIRKSTTKDNSVQVIIETPRGCRNKYKYDEENGRLKLSKVLPEGMMFPYDFGFIPDTKAE
ncbi:MAG TPA: inorganic diphosphatase, partial [Terriglobales bacterium]|nr:inorganic diphosphatase [Terriglobales bacterium]